MKLMELIEALSTIARDNDLDDCDADDNVEVLLAHQPSYPLQFAIGNIVCIEIEEHADDPDDPEPVMRTVVYIGEGGGQAYLNHEAAQHLEWR